jgi:hypothetical protein
VELGASQSVGAAARGELVEDTEDIADTSRAAPSVSQRAEGAQVSVELHMAKDDFALPAGFEMLMLAEAEAIKRGTSVDKIDKTDQGFCYTLADGSTFEIARRAPKARLTR